MKPMSLAGSGYRVKPKTHQRGRSTAYYIFDEEQEHLYEIDHVHFMAQAQRFNTPTVTTGQQGDIDRISAEMVPITGTIWDMVVHFIDGATIAVEPPVAALIYKRILDHFDEHFRAMRQEKMYEAPDTEDFRWMAEFATAIRPWALQHNPELEVKRATQFRSFLPQRATFSQATVEEDKAKEPVIPKSLLLMDNIERYLENLNGG